MYVTQVYYLCSISFIVCLCSILFNIWCCNGKTLFEFIQKQWFTHNVFIVFSVINERNAPQIWLQCCRFLIDAIILCTSWKWWPNVLLHYWWWEWSVVVAVVFILFLMTMSSLLLSLLCFVIFWNSNLKGYSPLVQKSTISKVH